MARQGDQYSRFVSRRLTRRRFVGGIALAGAGLSAAAIVGCGDDDDDGSAASPTTASGATQQPAIKRGGKLIVGQNSDVTTFDPQVGISGSDSNFNYCLFDSLVAYDREVKPNGSLSLAQNWEQPDPQTLIFHLRDATFHDGTPVDAAAIKWNITRIKDPASKTTNNAQFQVVSSVETPDSKTVVFKLSQVAADMLNTLGSRAALIMSPTAFEKSGANFASNPVGSGPFTFQSRTIGDRSVFARNPNYWRKGADGGTFPYLDSVELRYIQDATARVSALLAGDIHLDVDVSPKDVERVKSDSKLKTVVLQGSIIAHAMQYNYALAPMDDQNLRLAIAYAMNPQDIVSGVYLGQATVAKGGYWPPTLWVYSDIPGRPTFDLKKAKELVAASKYKGETISLSTWNRPDVTQATSVVAEHLKQAGINTEITNGDVGQIAARFYREKAFHLFSSPFGLYPEPNHIAQNVYSSKGAQNAGALSGGGQDADIDDLVNKGRATYDLAERKKIYNELERLVMSRAKPMVPTVYGQSTRGAVKGLGNFETVALNGDSWLRFAEATLG